MKTEGAIRQKLKQVRFRYLKGLIEDALARRPNNCFHNGPLEGADSVRVCFDQVDVPGRKIVICDDRIGGCDRTASCAQFRPKNDKTLIKSTFYAELEEMSFPEIAFNYPDMAALLWVLADEGLEIQNPDPHEFDLPDSQPVAVIAESSQVLAPLDVLVVEEPTPLLVDVEHPLDRVQSSSWVDRIRNRVFP